MQEVATHKGVVRLNSQNRPAISVCDRQDVTLEMHRRLRLPGRQQKTVLILSDFAPGAEAGKVFEQHFAQGGGTVLDTLKVPLANPEFALLQVRDRWRPRLWPNRRT
jgi:hypothetical protein